MFKELNTLVEKIIKYTTTWSITETEWYWNIACVRRPNNIDDKEITWDEFMVAVREEILYDLVYKNGACLEDQMNNDFCSYSPEYDGKSPYARFLIERRDLEEEIKKYIKDFKIYWDEESFTLMKDFKGEE